MARIYQVRKRSSDGRFDYTVSSDEEGWAYALGYCGGWCDPAFLDAKSRDRGWPAMSKEDRARMLVHREKYHATGHATAAEAEACYREYELDNCVRYRVDATTKKQCAACGEWTGGRALLGDKFTQVFVLCEAHQTPEHVASARSARHNRDE